MAVTHDLNVALGKADRLLLMHRGRISADGRPAEIDASRSDRRDLLSLRRSASQRIGEAMDYLWCVGKTGVSTLLVSCAILLASFFAVSSDRIQVSQSRSSATWIGAGS